MQRTATNRDRVLALQLQAAESHRDRFRDKKPVSYAEFTDDDDDDVDRLPKQTTRYANTTSESSGPAALKLRIKLPKTAVEAAQKRQQQYDQQEQRNVIDSSDSMDEGFEENFEAKRLRNTPHCLLTDEELGRLDDEVELVLRHREAEGGDNADKWTQREYYVKWARHSYIHCSWDSYATLSQLAGFKRVLNYCRKMEERLASRAGLSAEDREAADVRDQLEADIESQHSQVERIIAERLKEQISEDVNTNTNNQVQFLCKWKGLPYAEASWELEQDVVGIPGAWEMVEDFRKREQRCATKAVITAEKARRKISRMGYASLVALQQQPDFLGTWTGPGADDKSDSDNTTKPLSLKLRDYQLEGLNWMMYAWAKGTNAILADEMGLGKTIQAASFIGYLSEVQSIGGPFLIVVPLSTISNWAKEFQKWIPSVNTVVYVGTAASRQVIRAFEFDAPGVGSCRTSVNGFMKFDALITTYELVLKDAHVLRSIPWACLLVDEAHRLKNNESALYKELSQWDFKFKLLITGTPLQNNIRELWALLHFLHPDRFSNVEEFVSAHDLQDPAGVQRLHAILRPHLLRRVIKDVEKSLPPKNERILRVAMTPLQRQYYKWILTRNFTELNKSSKGSQVTLLNIIMDLKKCCNHPFLFESAREEYSVPSSTTLVPSPQEIADRLVVTSGKMVLLDKLLRRLKETGHRVLIFSQMVRVLDIISEYLTLRGYRHQRLDGSTPAQQRHLAMERFNAPGSEDFAFLLSTRAGGLGINLATADTVLLFDSDWNPQNDLQAMARAHRIGQKDIVNIYRLVTSGSVEEDILERAKRKMVLDHVVIQRMDTSGRTVLNATNGGGRLFGKDELAAILKFGAAELFADADEADEDDEAAVKSSLANPDAKLNQLMTDEDLDAVLERAELVDSTAGGSVEGSLGGSLEPSADLLSSFNVATFKAMEVDDAEFWSRLIPESMRPQSESQNKLTGKLGIDSEDLGIRTARLRALESSQTKVSEIISENAENKTDIKAENKRTLEQANSVSIHRWPQAVDDDGNVVADESGPRPQDFPRALSKRDAGAFVRAVKRHGLLSKLDTIAAEAGGALPSAGRRALLALWHGFFRGLEKACSMSNDDEKGTTSTMTFFGANVKAHEVLSFIRQMALLERRVKQAMEDGSGGLKLSPSERPGPTAWMKDCWWTPEDDAALLIGIYRYGLGGHGWDSIASDPELRLSHKLGGFIGKTGKEQQLDVSTPTPSPKASHLETRALGLLRRMQKVALQGNNNKEKAKITQKSKSQRKNDQNPTYSKVSQTDTSSILDKKFEELLGSETCTIIRKLRTLQRRGKEMDAALVVNKTKKYMTAIGSRIDQVASTGAEKVELWDYVSRFTENAMSGEKLGHVYSRLAGQ